jgi:nitroimidazol reductase NimA-like FMN-containing flavoprotein (pyridoxamine 5'-phosphate oxidase superfamily)
MGIQEMSDAECRTFLRRVQIGRLGCALDDQPYVVPINVVLEEDYLYSFATLGQKVEWMRKNPKVCVQVDEIAGPRWVSVIATGRYQELREPELTIERAHAHKLLNQKQRWWLNAVAQRQLKSGDELMETIFFRIRIESLSGLEGTESSS